MATDDANTKYLQAAHSIPAQETALAEDQRQIAILQARVEAKTARLTETKNAKVTNAVEVYDDHMRAINPHQWKKEQLQKHIVDLQEKIHRLEHRKLREQERADAFDTMHSSKPSAVKVAWVDKRRAHTENGELWNLIVHHGFERSDKCDTFPLMKLVNQQLLHSILHTSIDALVTIDLVVYVSGMSPWEINWGNLMDGSLERALSRPRSGKPILFKGVDALLWGKLPRSIESACNSISNFRTEARQFTGVHFAGRYGQGCATSEFPDAFVGKCPSCPRRADLDLDTRDELWCMLRDDPLSLYTQEVPPRRNGEYFTKDQIIDEIIGIHSAKVRQVTVVGTPLFMNSLIGALQRL